MDRITFEMFWSGNSVLVADFSFMWLVVDKEHG